MSKVIIRPAGQNGSNGQGVPTGGDQYALLAKATNADYDTEWTRQPNVEAVQLDLANGIPPVEGLLTWNIDERTADLGRGNDVVLQLGEELHYPMARNAEATTLLEGELVMVDPTEPAQGQRLRVKRFVADGTYPSDLFVGMCTEAILPNEIGIITWFGQVRGLDLPTLEPSGETWAEGDILWPNPLVAGGMSNVEPSAPALKITVAAILRISGNNLNVLLRPNLRSKLADLHDVQVTTPSNGQVLTWNGSIWVNANNDVDGVQTVTGDGVGGTASDVVMTFPTPSEIGAYPDTNPDGFVDASGASAAAPIQSVNGQTGTVVLDLDDINDVQLTTPTDGQVLRYDSGVWENGDEWTTTTANTGTLTGYNVVWLADTTSARNRTLDASGARLQVKDVTGSAGANNITLTAPSGQTINGNADETIDVNYGWVEYVRSGTNWVTIGGQ